MNGCLTSVINDDSLRQIFLSKLDEQKVKFILVDLSNAIHEAIRASTIESLARVDKFDNGKVIHQPDHATGDDKMAINMRVSDV